MSRAESGVGEFGDGLLEVGTDAPDFTLSSIYGDPVTLSSFRERMKVCLVFLDSAGSAVETDSDLLDAEVEELVGAGVERLGVVPSSYLRGGDSLSDLEVDFPLVVDSDLQVARSYGALDRDGEEIVPMVYLIDEAGRVLYGRRGYPPPEEILEVVDDE